QSVIRDLIEKSEILINSIPATPDFLKGLKYREPKKKWFNFRKKEESEQIKSMIANCRHSLNSYIERRSNDPRKEINKNLLRYDNQSDLHSLRAIYLFNETSNPSNYGGVSEMATQKMDENRFKNLKKSLQEMMFAVLNGSTSLYNINWFIQIYNEFLNTLSRMINYKHYELVHHDNKQFKKTIEELYTAKIKVMALTIKREELEPFKVLSRKLAGSSYAVENFTEKTIKEAGHALEKEPGKLILHKMNANNIIVVLMTTLLLLAKVPLFNAKKLVEKILGLIPEVTTNLEMRKRVVMTSIYVTEYKTALALGNLEDQKKIMQTMYDFTLETIKTHVGEEVSTKWHADQILRIAWIALCSEEPILFAPAAYKLVLKQAYICLGKIIYNCTIDTKPRENEPEFQKISPKQKLIDEAVICRCKIVEIGKNHGLNLEDIK
ncbi:MAG: hypothetical protein MJE63_00720, partial [Proteobacteria bacterium]|nr:hypothetical protein [Pseudomonadota bacterium]